METIEVSSACLTINFKVCVGDGFLHSEGCCFNVDFGVHLLEGAGQHRFGIFTAGQGGEEGYP